MLAGANDTGGPWFGFTVTQMPPALRGHQAVTTPMTVRPRRLTARTMSPSWTVTDSPVVVCY